MKHLNLFENFENSDYDKMSHNDYWDFRETHDSHKTPISEKEYDRIKNVLPWRSMCYSHSGHIVVFVGDDKETPIDYSKRYETMMIHKCRDEYYLVAIYDKHLYFLCDNRRGIINCLKNEFTDEILGSL